SSQLKNLLIEKAMTSADAMEAAVQAGMAPNSSETYKAISQATKDLDQSIISLIGTDTTERLEALKSTTYYSSGNAIDEPILDMEDAGVALSADQSETLLQDLRDLANSAKNPDSSATGYKDPDPATWQSPMDQQFFTKAASILTPRQLEILETATRESNQRESIINQYRTSRNEPVMITN
ncbi:MAG TPA: hypothetical protein VFE25_09590, partial [Opitutaceae bacterium]|nr:hypothetical protein [Opitutaceae bacterium]